LTVCLLSKKRPREFPDADITGIRDLPDLWLVGYGLDDRGTKRGWTEIFAMPKVVMVDTDSTEEVEQLLDKLDDSASLTAHHVIAGKELVYRPPKTRYRVTGMNAEGHTDHNLPGSQTPGQRITSKADIQCILKGVSTVKGKFDHEMQIALIQDSVNLVAEDEIFSGNKQLYAELRCRLRQQITKDAKLFAVPGIESIVPE